MKDLSVYYEIARLIAAELSETITPEEKVKLQVWLAEDERHYMRYCRIRERLKRGEGENIFRNPERVREDMEKLKRKLSGNKRRFLLSGNYFGRYVAVAVLTIGIAIGLIQRPWEDRSSEELPIAQQPTVQPGSYKAMLTLANGEQVSLEEWSRDSLWKDGMLIRKRKGELTYEQKAGDMQQEKMLFNTITIPRSGEYKLVLSDGTKVWLNSASKLKYPVAFTGGQRKVLLEGEAYFEVAADTAHPFLVETSGMSVTVLGTGFNVMAYPEEMEAAVTLVHGKVGVQTDHRQQILQPDEQYVYQTTTRRGTVRKVDVSQYVDWKDGILNFDSMPLEELTRKLSRWYDVDFFFVAEELKTLKYSGAFKKYNDIRYVLNIIEEITNVQFVLNERTIVVNRR